MRVFSEEKVPKPFGNYSFLDNLTEPIDIEIGSGTGHFAIAYCREHPQRSLVAIEKTSEKFRKCVANKEVVSELVPNLHLVHGNAVNWITHFTNDEQIENCFILYPNPYPKSKQANKRFMNMSFIECLRRKLRAGGKIHLATNDRAYFKEAVEMFTSVWDFTVVEARTVSPTEPWRTLFEKKYLERGETCYNLVLRK